MTIDEFVKKASKQDSRNIFESYEGDVSSIPSDIKDFYVRANPVDVEIRTRKFGYVRFFSIEQIRNLHKEYSFMKNDSFIFASTNGDPLFIENSNYFITYESRYNPEYLSDSFFVFLDVLNII